MPSPGVNRLLLGIPGWVHGAYEAADFSNQRYWSRRGAGGFTGWIAALGGTFTRATIGTYVNSSGLIVTASSGQARFDRDFVTLAPLGLRLEGQRTNPVFPSSANGGSTVGTATLTGNYASGLAGAQTATRYQGDSGTGRFFSASASAGQNVTYSIYGKGTSGAATLTERLFSLPGGGQNVSGGALTSTAWTRYPVTRLLPSGDTSVQARVLNGQTANDMIVDGLQVEVGTTFASTLIPTTNASVTRNADILTFPAAGETSGAVTLYAKTPGGTDGNQVLWQTDDGSEANRVRLVRDSSRHIRFVVTNASSDVVNLDLGLLPDNTSFGVSAQWMTNSFTASIIGGLSAGSSSGAVPSGLTTRRLGSDSAGTSNWYGTVAQYFYWPSYRSLDTVAAVDANTTALAIFGNVRGNWNAGILSLTNSPVYAARDIVKYGSLWYYCILGYTATSSDPATDTTHWQNLPTNLGTVVLNDSMNYNDGALNGRVTTEGKTWTATGTGYLTAVVGSGYATSTANTYAYMTGLGRITRVDQTSNDNTGVDFTTAIGHPAISAGGPTNVSNMLHVSYGNGAGLGMTTVYWYQPTSTNGSALYSGNTLYYYDSGWVPTQNVTYHTSTYFLGKFIFAFVDGVLVNVICADIIKTIGDMADEFYVQFHATAPLGTEKIYNVTVAAS